MSKPLIHAADLFCGAGGTSTGLLQAAQRAGMRVQLLALNHWQVAITTHGLNHPDVQHLWADIQGIEPRKVVPGGHLRVLCASPECIYFSRARGGKPINDQRRSSASYLLSWVRQLDIDDLLIENVPEFEQWGPLYREDHPDPRLRNRPIPELRGTLFQEFIGKLRHRGYRVEWRTLCAADYGDATTRERLFIRARLGGGPITWPAPTHARGQWRAAREIIDWSVRGTSIYGRKNPLVPATMKRILAGVQKFSGLAPFLIPNYGDKAGSPPRTCSIERPLPSIAGRGGGMLVQPCLVEYHGDHRGRDDGGVRSRSVDEPLRTLDTSNRFGLAQPFLTKLYGGHDACPVTEPLGTITAQYEHYGLAQPCLTVLRNHADGIPIDGPLPTICANGQHVGVTVPFLTEYYGTGTAQSVDDPLATVTTRDRFGLAQPALMAYGAGHSCLLDALQHPDPLYRPLVAEIDGVLYLVDILYRMLLVKELAAAMGFPAEYLFAGTQGDQVRQVGNAVPVGTSEAQCYAMLTN